jgi:phosphoglycolate phosphatase
MPDKVDAAGPAARLTRPRAILFDWDNTLIDTWGVIHDALNVTLVAMNHAPWTLDETKSKVRSSLREAFPLMFGADWEKAGRIYTDAYAATHLERLSEMPGAERMLDELAGRGLYLGVVSNKLGPFLRREADRLGWTAKFARLVGASDTPRDKPAIDPVDLALSGSGIARGSDVWFVGDTDIDMVCAHNSQCVPVLLRATAPQGDEFGPQPPLRWVADCAGLARLIAEL